MIGKKYEIRRVEEPIAELPPLRTVLEDFPHTAPQKVSKFAVLLSRSSPLQLALL